MAAKPAKEALAEFDAWLEAQQAERERKQKAQEAYPAPAAEREDEDYEVFGDYRSRGFIIGPWPQDEQDNFLREIRLWQESKDKCAECQALNDAEPNSPARIMCSLHMGWGAGLCWKRGE